MSEQFQATMSEATRLTREGRLAEATAVLQHALGGKFAPEASPEGSGGVEDQITVSPRVPNRVPEPAPTDRSLRPAPRPPRRLRNAPRVPGSTEGTPTPPIVSAGGQFVERFYRDQAGGRAYKVYIPSGYVGQAVPLVVMLHGCTQSPDDFAAGTRMNTLAEAHTFLVAYPAQSANANSSRCWNWFKTADQQRGRGEPSLIAGITQEVVEEYHVATDRVFVAGMSAGGAMAAVMGLAYPDLYAAIGVHSGLAPGAAHDLPSAFAAMQRGGPAQRNTTINGSTRAVPAILFHGDRDTTVHPRNGDNLLAHYQTAGTVGKPNIGDGISPRATTYEGRVPGGHSYTCATYHDANGLALVEHWTVHGLGHAWSGGSTAGSYTDPKGPDASAEMVRFFQQASQR